MAGLEAGAADYKSKPAVPKELAARLRALLRRARRSEGPDDAVRFGTIEIERDAGVVRKKASKSPSPRPSSSCCASWPRCPTTTRTTGPSRSRAILVT